MLQRAASMRSFLSRWMSRLVLPLLVLLLSAGLGRAQNLSFTPGVSSLYAGDVLGQSSVSGPNYAGLPSGLVFGQIAKTTYDANGNLYMMDPGNQILRVVAAGTTPIPVLPGVAVQAGQVYTVAGTTNSATSSIPCAGGVDLQGNGCPATVASVYGDNVILDANGNVYVDDRNYGQIRVIYGGKGTLPGISSPRQGYIYALTNAANNVDMADNTGDNGPAINATTPGITALAIDGNGNIYIADNVENQIRMIYMGGSNLPPSYFGGATPTVGNIYLLSAPDPSQVCPDPTGVCDGQPLPQAYYESISAMATDAAGNLYVVDWADYEVRVVYVAGNIPGVTDPVPGYIYALAGNFSFLLSGTTGPVVNGALATATPLTFSNPSGQPFGAIATDSANNVYFVGNGTSNIYTNNIIYKVDPSGILTTAFGGTAPCTTPADVMNDGCAATSVGNGSFAGLAVDSKGNLYVSDLNYGGLNLILKSTVATSTLDYSGTIGLPTPGQSLYVSNTGTAGLQLSSIDFTGPFNQVLTGANDCSATTLLPAGASCQISVSFLPTGSGTATGNLVISSNAQNATDGTNTASFSGTAAQASSTTNLVISPSAPTVANIGQTVTFTATIVPQYQDTLVPSGTVAIMNGATQLGSANVVNGVATFASSSIPAGKDAITAVYSGDLNFVTSTSSPVSLTVSATPAAVVTLSTSTTTANSGQSVALMANVSAFSGAGVPTGPVTFQVGPNPLPNGTVMLNGGMATLNTTSLPPGNNQIIAVYGGDANFAANASTKVSVTVTSSGQLQFTPGLISQVSGSYFTTGTPVNGTTATVAKYQPYTTSVAVDSYGNTYVPGGRSVFLYATASGNGPIPGVTNPVKGNIYVIGNGTACANNSPTPCGEGGPVSQASFVSVGAIAVDALNDIYVQDGSVIRRITAATGVITTVAGTWYSSNGIAQSGFSGDNGPATSAKIYVSNLSVDPNGNIYIADNYDGMVRRVDGLTGIITTIAGDVADFGKTGPAGSSLWFCQTLPCGDGGLASSAALVGPTSIFVDAADNIYIADVGYNNEASGNVEVIRRIDAKSGVISLFAGQYTEGPYAEQCGASTGISCGDGSPAIRAIFNGITSVAGDQAGNIYIADSSLAAVRKVNIQTGIINNVIGDAADEGSPAGQCATAPCGDGGPATSARLKTPKTITLDPQGNMYVFDEGEDVVREVTGATSALAYGSWGLGTTTPQTLTVSNIGAQPLTFSGLSIPAPNYEQQASGGTDCAATTTLAAGDACQLAIAFFPTAEGPLPATASIASNATNAVSGANTIALSGTGASLGGSTPQAITFPMVQAGLSYGSAPILLNASADSGQPITYEVTGPATVAGSTLTITGAGTAKITAYQFGSSQYAAATPVSQSFTVAPATLTVSANNLSLNAGATLPAPTYSITGFAGSDTQATTTTGAPTLTVVDSSGTTYPVGSTPLSGTYTIKIAQGTLALTAAEATDYNFLFTNGTLNVTGAVSQTITFGALNDVTYGASTIKLAANSNSGLPISYSVQGPATVLGNLLTITGTGAVAVTATQSGDAQYSAATPVTQAFNVTKAALNVAAVSVSVAQGAPLPSFTYTITGFVNGDTQAVVSGSPVLTTTATSNSPIGQYPITVAVGTLSAANYTFTPVASGTLSIITPQVQTITFPAIANVTYGAAPIPLGATTSSGLGVSYAVTGPATLSGDVLTIIGAGTVVVTANQAGNSVYGPALTVMRSFNVVPAVLTLTAGDVTRQNNTPNPAFTYTITGFVNNDTSGVAISGTPVLSTTATVTSSPGIYAIMVAAGTLNSANYTFNFVPGVLTITTGGPVSDFSVTATPQSVSVIQGQIVQSTIALSPVNFYQGLVSFSCSNLPANVSCVFSPATLAPAGSNVPLTTTLTINTSAAPVVGQLQSRLHRADVFSATLLWLPAGITGLCLAFRRRQVAKRWKVYSWLMLLLLLSAMAGLSACGGGASSSSSSTSASPGNSTITVTATDATGAVSHAINVSLTVE